MTDKIKLLTISDMPLVPSGVGSQTRYILEGLLKTGRYKIVSLGGAIRHNDYRPVRLEQYGEDFTIYPVDGYGNQQLIRDVLDQEKPDALWFMTDPRFYFWLFEMSDEIKERNVPMLYYHVWDEMPTPHFNLPYYLSCDFIGCISKLTYKIMQDLNIADRAEYIPHAVDSNIFAPHSDEQKLKNKIEILGAENSEKFVIFYNSRNARRKMTADVVKTFKMFLDEVGANKAFLFMHTDPHDQEGSNLYAVCDMLGLKQSNIKFSNHGQPTDVIAKYYNIADVTINISNNEGWGLSCHESLSCGVPVIVNRTGGLQDQVKDDKGNVFGVCIEPATVSIQGSQQIPYIYDCRVADKDVVNAYRKMFNMSPRERRALGMRGREWTLKAFALQDMIDKWDNAIQRHMHRQYQPQKQLKCAAL